MERSSPWVINGGMMQLKDIKQRKTSTTGGNNMQEDLIKPGISGYLNRKITRRYVGLITITLVISLCYYVAEFIYWYNLISQQPKRALKPVEYFVYKVEPYIVLAAFAANMIAAFIFVKANTILKTALEEENGIAVNKAYRLLNITGILMLLICILSLASVIIRLLLK